MDKTSASKYNGEKCNMEKGCCQESKCEGSFRTRLLKNCPTIPAFFGSLLALIVFYKCAMHMHMKHGGKKYFKYMAGAQIIRSVGKLHPYNQCMAISIKGLYKDNKKKDKEVSMENILKTADSMCAKLAK